ncbi:serine/threonine protein kinase [Haliangium sp.]|uniref:serine/threonine protein kinase n=1 Tax=Haliangium sp. TaxID=2663208 RepID=UPI003D0A9E16
MGDRYTITERLDQGGMAEVFRGVAESLQGFKKSVAIKRILPSLTKNDKFVSMFLDEAKLSLYLQHANIVQVFDIGVTEASYFLVMEYVDGCNLKALLERLKERDRRIDIALAIYLMLECCKALNYAHHAENPENHEPLNIVHRDVSPPNILLSKMGEVKLVDFGLAKANSQIESTDPGVVKGKFSYLSPEAASGLEVDHRADVFAVGIILWEMFTGRRLFYGDTDYQTVELVRQARIPSIAALNPEVEQELEAIVRKALARDPAERYQHAADLGDALAQYLFSRRMKVTARDLAALVKDTQLERMRKRSTEPKESLIDVLIQEEMAKVTSLLEDGSPATANQPAEGSESLDPDSFIDTTQWTSALFDDDGVVDLVGPPSQPAPPRTPTAPPTPPPPSTADLSSLLEPDRTEERAGTEEPASRGMLVALVIALVLAALVGAGLFLFKDKIFGDNTASGQSEAVQVGSTPAP